MEIANIENGVPIAEELEGVIERVRPH